MDLILAMDLMNQTVVHGLRGERETYRPLDWGLSPTADPVGYVRYLSPRYLYIADLDRIRRTGTHDEVVRSCAAEVEHTYLDRGCRTPADYLYQPDISNVVGTETAEEELTSFHGGYLSLDLHEGKVLPYGTDPVDILSLLSSLDFMGAILLNISAVGTACTPQEDMLRTWRDAWDGPLLYGGGVSGQQDLFLLRNLGYTGAILATSVHRGTIPLIWIQEGCLC